jgi:hypothetical protein
LLANLKKIGNQLHLGRKKKTLVETRDLTLLHFIHFDSEQTFHDFQMMGMERAGSDSWAAKAGAKIWERDRLRWRRSQGRPDNLAQGRTPVRDNLAQGNPSF